MKPTEVLHLHAKQPAATCGRLLFRYRRTPPGFTFFRYRGILVKHYIKGEPLNIMDKKANHFSGQLGFVLAAAGSAVGVGNLWRFPYLAAMGRAGVVVGALCSLPRISSR